MKLIMGFRFIYTQYLSKSEIIFLTAEINMP